MPAEGTGFAAFYTIVGFSPAPFTRVTDGGKGSSARVRTYGHLAEARAMITRLNKAAKGGVTYSILQTAIYEGGNHTTEWVD